MKVSIEWLRDYVNFDLEPEKVAEILSMSGTSVERIIEQKIAVSGVVVARVMNVLPHPNARNLKVAQVDDGDRLRDIVCGAPNLREGMLTALALPGARIHCFDKQIESTNIRGVRSDGMLLSPAELGLSEDASAIAEIGKNCMPGERIENVVPFTDAILEIEVTPNRPDCMAVLGIAREISALLDVDLITPVSTFDETGPDVNDLVVIEVEDTRGCPRYTARVVTGVSILPSPLWLQRRISACGLRPINNVVDITNYVLLELGQPLHAFDLELIGERKIIVRKARYGETITTLDGIERQLDSQTVLIADSDKPIAIAGVMGGKNTEVGETTRNVVIESAHFDPTSIFLTSKRLGIRTEASSRFERGTDPEGTAFAARRAAFLMKELAEGVIARGEIDIYNQPWQEREIDLRNRKISAVLGIDIPLEETRRILERLGAVVEGNGDMRVRVPSYRGDLQREIDLIEEIARIYGYERIEDTLPPGGGIASGLTREQVITETLLDALVAQGLYEVITYSFMRASDLDILKVPPGHVLRRVAGLLNPLSETGEALRTTLLPGILRIAQINQSRGNKDLALFEKGRVFYLVNGTSLVEEKDSLCIFLSGNAVRSSWIEEDRRYDFFDLKVLIENSFEFIGVSEINFEEASFPWLLKGRSASLRFGNRDIGYAGQVDPEISESFDLDGEIYVAEILIDWLNQLPGKPVQYSDFGKFPGVKLDIAVVLDKGVPAGRVLSAIMGSGAAHLRNVRLFDVYEGEQIPEGKKSLAFSLEFASVERTLTEDEAFLEVQKILRVLQEKFGAELRGKTPGAGENL